MKILEFLFIGVLVGMISSCIFNKEIELINQDKTHLYPVSYNGKWGYANEFGDLVIACKYDTVSFFSSGLAVVCSESKYGYLTTNDKWQIKPQYDYATNFGYTCATVIKDGIEKKIDRYNKKCKEELNTYIGCKQPMVRAKIKDHSIEKRGKYAIISDKFLKPITGNKGSIIRDTTDFVFDDIMEFSLSKLLIQKGNKFGLYDINGIDDVRILTSEREVFEIDKGYDKDSIIFQFDELKINYQTLGNSQERYEVSNTPFRIGKYWGIISSCGEVITQSKYLDIEISGGWGRAKVEFENNKYGYIDYYKNIEYFKRQNASNNIKTYPIR